jgi:hypothetical protein
VEVNLCGEDRAYSTHPLRVQGILRLSEVPGHLALLVYHMTVADKIRIACRPLPDLQRNIKLVQSQQPR